jgi:hypothetical protein
MSNEITELRKEIKIARNIIKIQDKATTDLMKENTELRACHEAELGVCQNHCDIVKEQEEHIKLLQGELKRRGIQVIFPPDDEK